jgi:uncharacterized protein YkwD
MHDHFDFCIFNVVYRLHNSRSFGTRGPRRSPGAERPWEGSAMDDARFDELARNVARDDVSRRGILGGIAGGALALVLSRHGADDVAAKKRRKKGKGKHKKKRRKRRGGKGSNTGSTNGGGGSGSGSGAGDSLDAEERDCLDLINAHRAANGRSPLAAQGQLTAAADRHSQDMAANGFFSHTGSDGTDGGQRIRQAGYSWTAWGENISWHSGDASANAAFTGWRNSRPHNANMLDAGFTEIGIARVRSASSGRWYWTTTFGDR